MLRPEPPPLVTGEAARLAWIGGGAYPAFDARVAGQGVLLIADTGANQHALERGASFWLGLPVRGAAGVTDAVGIGVRVLDHGPVAVGLGMRGAPDRLRLLGFADEALLATGAAGLISPQRLAPDGGHVELDLPAGRARLRAGPPDGGAALQPTCAAEDGVPLFVADATVDGVPGFFVIDTGSDRSGVLLEGRFADRFRDRRRPGRRVATLGAEGRVDEAPDVEVEVAGWGGRVTLDLLTAAPGRCPSDGTLASDVLRHCVLRVSRSGGALDCRTNATSSPARSARSRAAIGS